MIRLWFWLFVVPVSVYWQGYGVMGIGDGWTEGGLFASTNASAIAKGRACTDFEIRDTFYIL
ncbi:hypothetical protein C5B78_05635 [Aeromonas salmonicida]|nr:hypothetical protein C5B78_05635 [Aeromonas salmonicida]